MSLPTKTLFCAYILSVLLTAAVRAATVSLNPVADAFVTAGSSDPNAGSPNANYGGTGALAVSAAALPKGEFDSLLKFDLSSAKATFDGAFGATPWAIDSITLQLTSSQPNNSIFNGNGAGPGGSNVNFAGAFLVKWMQNDSWIEGNGSPASPGSTGITYSTLPTFLTVEDEPLGTFAFGGGTSGNNTWNLALANSFKADATAGGTVSLLLLPADGMVGYLAGSRSSGSRPLLIVGASAVPEPTTSALLAGAACTWGARRRRYAGPR